MLLNKRSTDWIPTYFPSNNTTGQILVKMIKNELFSSFLQVITSELSIFVLYYFVYFGKFVIPSNPP